MEGEDYPALISEWMINGTAFELHEEDFTLQHAFSSM